MPTTVPTVVPSSNPTQQPITARPTTEPITGRPTEDTTEAPTPTEIETCGGFAHCVAYTNGCNDCSCRGSISFCGGKLCNSYGESVCTECKDGYVLIDGECQLDLDLCELPMEIGPCEAAMNRYYHNVDTGECELFLYGGCDGNANNFETVRECNEQCQVDAGFGSNASEIGLGYNMC